jgi:beta-glucosidase
MRGSKTEPRPEVKGSAGAEHAVPSPRASEYARAVRRRSGSIARALALALAACGDGAETAAPAEPTEPAEVTFPKGFLWGAATAGFQIEKGLADTDWGAWAATPGKIAGGDRPDDGPDALAHIEGDVALMKSLGLRSYRFSAEMARIYPTRASFDADMPAADGVAAYDALLAALDAAGIVPMVTLHHFVWPIYMSDPAAPKDPQGFERADAVEVFAEWCRRMGKRYGDRVDLWVSINEPLVEASVGFIATVFPPGVGDPPRAVAVMRRQQLAHARCYDALHEADAVDADGDGAAALVSVAKHNRVYEPADPADPADLEATSKVTYFWNRWFLDAIVHGRVDEDLDGVAEIGMDPDLVGRADYLGLNYYGVSHIDADLSFPVIGAVPVQLDLPTPRPKTDVGWDIHPEGFAQVIDEAATYGLPIYVTENGVADAKDVNRARFLGEHVFEIGKALARGVELRAYQHWALIDNFEWASGYCPRFGLYRVDYDDPARPRSPTSAVVFYRDLIAGGRLRRADLDALPAYESKPNPCKSF